MAEIIRRPKEEFIKMIQSGAVRKVAPVIPEPEKKLSHPGSVEHAKKLFGNDFYGEEAIERLNEKIRFDICNANFKFAVSYYRKFPFTEDQLKNAKDDEKNGRERILVLRPAALTMDGISFETITLNKLIKYKIIDKYRDITLTYFLLTYLGLKVADYFEPYLNETLKPGFAMPTKYPIPNSAAISFSEQEKLIPPGESRRSAVEAVWDMKLCQANGMSILRDNWDWTRSERLLKKKVAIANGRNKMINSLAESISKSHQDLRMYTQIK